MRGWGDGPVERDPPELQGLDWGEDDAPRRRRPLITLVAWLCIIGLVLGVAAGLFSIL